MALNDTTVSEIVKDLNNGNEKFSYYLYGVISRLSGNKFYILNFSDMKIDLVRIAGICTVVDHSYIPVDSIHSIKFSNWFFGMGRKIKIITTDRKIVFRINKFNIMGMKKQKEYLLNIEEEYRKLGLVI